MADPCTSPIDCENKDITPEQALKKLVVRDANGCAALNTVVVAPYSPSPSTGGCNPYIDCDNKEIDWRALFFKMITTDSNGCWALRTIESNPAP